ncbi:MAG: HNH endonuclease [Thermoguttaceae bacterium]|jgi:hypothetical protein
MDNIPQNLIDQMMVKCARRCCICRRFRPTKLQVHHIKPKGDDGTNEEDNLIVTCITCHVDVHSQVPFTRRFTYEELKGHCDALIQMVADGKLPDNEPDNTDQIIERVSGKISIGNRIPEVGSLSSEAIKLLLAAAYTTGDRQGMILVSEDLSGLEISPGDQDCPYEIGNKRGEAKFKVALIELENKGLIEKHSDSIYEVTHLGYLLSDEITSLHSQSDLPSP